VARRHASIASLVVRFKRHTLTREHFHAWDISGKASKANDAARNYRSVDGFGTSFAFALMPLAATLVAIFRFGSKVTLANIVDVLVAATIATPM
jgi:hypothetical protein